MKGFTDTSYQRLDQPQ